MLCRERMQEIAQRVCESPAPEISGAELLLTLEEGASPREAEGALARLRCSLLQLRRRQPGRPGDLPETGKRQIVEVTRGQ